MGKKKQNLYSPTQWVEQEIKTLHDRYWSLWHKHERLLKHLGLTEQDVPAKKELRACTTPAHEEPPTHSTA